MQFKPKIQLNYINSMMSKGQGTSARGTKQNWKGIQVCSIKRTKSDSLRSKDFFLNIESVCVFGIENRLHLLWVNTTQKSYPFWQWSIIIWLFLFPIDLRLWWNTHLVSFPFYSLLGMKLFGITYLHSIVYPSSLFQNIFH